MKKIFFAYLVAAMNLISLPVFSQEDDVKELGLPGDNLDLYAVMTLFQKSKTIEDFEKTLNEEKTGINNLDLNLDKKVDFIKVTTKKSNETSYTFVLQVDVSKSETQDVAVILLDKNKDKKVSLQIVGDEELYGKNYVVEPKATTSSVTANPAYQGSDPVTVNVPATTVVVEQAPIVQYVYSPAYVPYYPPYYYGYYPPYFAAFTVMAVGIYRHNHYYHHHGYYGGHYGGGNVVIHNENNFNNYNRTRNTSNTVANNRNSGRYNTGNNRGTASNRATNSNRPSTSNRATTGRESTKPSTSNRTSASTRPSTGTTTRSSTGSSRPSVSSTSSRPSSSSMGAGRTRSYGGGSMGGGGRRR